jgi:RNA polymerase sigma factor (sigma-70 family)
VDADAVRARSALEGLCSAYWYPLYAYARRRGYSPHDAEDLTQGFFARILRLNSLAKVDRERGKFRTFLIGSMNNFISDEWDRASAQKRSSQLTISLDAEKAENRYQSEPLDRMTPETVFERQWAMTLLENAVMRLRAEYEALGQGELFMETRFAITGDKSAVPYADLAARLGMSEDALRVAVHRLRQRYRRTLRDEISQTVADEAELAEELSYLRRVLSG